MEVCALALGANLGNRRLTLHGAADALRKAGLRVRASALYETPPWGDPDQPDYLNAVVAVEADTAQDWLEWSRRLEEAAGRTRDPARPNGPRTLDVDVVEVWRGGRPVRQDDPELTLPHPRAAERTFVMIPLAEVAGDRELAGKGQIRALVRRLARHRGDLRLIAEEW